MRLFYLILAIVIVSCNSDRPLTDQDQSAFEKMAQDYQTLYMEGSVNLDEILAGMDKDIQMWENGKVWTYVDLVKFGPHLPKKNVIDTYNEQKLLEPNLGYDFVSLRYINTQGDTLRETASRIWKNRDSQWQIVYMNNSIHKED